MFGCHVVEGGCQVGGGLPVGGGAAPGQVVVGAGRGPGHDGLLHRRHVSRVGLEEGGVLAGQHGSLVTPELGSSVLEPDLEPRGTRRDHFKTQSWTTNRSRVT